MELLTDDLILRTVTRADIDEIARMWNFFQGGVSVEEAHGALEYMNSNHVRNRSGILHHLCLAVCRKNDPARIWGWCGLDGTVFPERPEVFVLLHESVRSMGFGTQCVKALLAYAFDAAGLHSVHGGCDKDNIASARMMENAGMRRYGSMESGDPLFIAGKSPCDV